MAADGSLTRMLRSPQEQEREAAAAAARGFLVRAYTPNSAEGTAARDAYLRRKQERQGGR
jgi:hypothetical protein